PPLAALGQAVAHDHGVALHRLAGRERVEQIGARPLARRRGRPRAAEVPRAPQHRERRVERERQRGEPSQDPARRGRGAPPWPPPPGRLSSPGTRCPRAGGGGSSGEIPKPLPSRGPYSSSLATTWGRPTVSA